MSSSSKILGIDVSHHQGNIDWDVLSLQTDVRFVYLKATEGEGYVDPKLREYAEQCRKHAIAFGCYHFGRPDTGGGYEDGQREAADFVEAMASIPEQDLPPALDYEKYSEFGAAANIAYIDGFLEELENLIPAPKRKLNSPLIYTGKNIWRYQVDFTDKFVDQANLWQVFYTSKGPDSLPAMPWPEPLLWQFSGGRSCNFYSPDGIPGVGVCDVNRFMGDEDAFSQWIGKEPVPEPVPTPDPADPCILAAPLPCTSIYDLGEVYVSRLQGLLMSHGYGPQGLVGRDGLPDGIYGEKTAEALTRFRSETGYRGPVGFINEKDWFYLVQLK